MAETQKLQRRRKQEIEYWEAVLELLSALPRREGFRDHYRDLFELQHTEPRKGWSYTTCELCWRAVPYDATLKTKKFLCFLHRAASFETPSDRKRNQLTRRRLARLRPLVNEMRKIIARDLSKDPRLDGASDKERCEKRMYCLTNVSNTPVRFLAMYLNHEKQLRTHEEILYAFHGPFPSNLDTRYRDAMEEYFTEILNMPNLADNGNHTVDILTYEEMARAEAWIRAIKMDWQRKDWKRLYSKEVYLFLRKLSK